MIHLLLFFVLPLVFGATVPDSFTRQSAWSLQKGKKVGPIDLGTCYGGSFSITPLKKVSGWCSLFHVGNENKIRRPGAWLYPGSTRLHIRTSTDASWNEGCDVDYQLPLNKKSNVRFFACGRTVRVSIRTEHTNAPKVLTCKLKGRVTGGVQNLYVSDPWYPACGAKMEDAELFRALPNVAHDCTKLKTQEAALRQKALGEASAAERAIPVHAGVSKAQSDNLAALTKVKAMAASLKSLNAALRSQLNTLIAQLEQSCKNGLNAANQAKADAEQTVQKAKEVVKHLDVNKIHCECVEVKNVKGRKVNQAQTENNSLAKGITEHDRQIKVLDDMNKGFAQQLKMFQGTDWLALRMKALFGALIKANEDAIKDLNTKKTAFVAKKAANDALIKKYTDEITQCDNKLKQAKAKVFSFFTEEQDIALINSIDEMDFFEDLRFSEMVGANINLNEYEDAITADEFVSQQDLDGVETTQISYGLIGGAGVLTSGIFYYAYQRSKQNSY